MKKVFFIVCLGALILSSSISANEPERKNHSKGRVAKALLYGLSGAAFAALSAVKGYDLYKMTRHYILHKHTHELQMFDRRNQRGTHIDYEDNFTIWPLAKELAVSLTCLTASIGSFACMVKELRQK